MTHASTPPRTRRRPMLILSIAAAALAGAAHAQGPGPNPGPGHEGHRGAPSAEMKARHDAMQKQRLDDLRTVLRLRPDQEAALTAFAAAHERPGHGMMERGEMKGMRREPGGEPLTTPQRLERMAQHEAAMRARHDEMRQALATFYKALSPEQQKTFDALQRLQRGHGGRHGAGMAHGGMGDGPRIMIRKQMMESGGPK